MSGGAVAVVGGSASASTKSGGQGFGRHGMAKRPKRGKSRRHKKGHKKHGSPLKGASVLGAKSGGSKSQGFGRHGMANRPKRRKSHVQVPRSLSTFENPDVLEKTREFAEQKSEAKDMQSMERDSNLGSMNIDN